MLPQIDDAGEMKDLLLCCALKDFVHRAKNTLFLEKKFACIPAIAYIVKTKSECGQHPHLFFEGFPAKMLTRECDTQLLLPMNHASSLPSW